MSIYIYRYTNKIKIKYTAQHLERSTSTNFDDGGDVLLLVVDVVEPHDDRHDFGHFWPPFITFFKKNNYTIL